MYSSGLPLACRRYAIGQAAARGVTVRYATPTQAQFIGRASCGSIGGCILYGSVLPAWAPYVANARLHEHDLATGRERELYSFPSGQTGSVFAVAQQAELVVLVVRRQALIVVSTTTGAARTIGRALAVDAQTQVIPDGLLPDGRNLLVTTRRGDNAGPQTLWRVPLDGAAAQPLGSPKELARATTPGLLSPDGREILFAAGTVSSELWVLDANARAGQLSSSGSP